MVHNLKIWPEHFRAICEGRKRFEVRSTEDRCFEEGDDLILREWLPDEERFTGAKIRVEISLVYAGPGVAKGFAILSLGAANADLEHRIHELEASATAERLRLIDALAAARNVIDALGGWKPGNPITGHQLELIASVLSTEVNG